MPARPVVAVVGPLPPPLHGHMIVTQRVLGSECLRREFELVHVDLSDHRPLATVGQLDVENVRLALLHIRNLVAVMVGRRPAIVYLPLSQNRLGVFRDLALLAIALLGRASVVAHVHGGGFACFLEQEPRWFRAPAGALLRRCSRLVVMSAWQRVGVEEALPGVPVDLVPHGTAPTAEPDRQVAAGAPLRVLYASSGLLVSKGVATTLAAARLAEAQGPDCLWTLVGAWADASDRAVVEREAAELKSVRLAGELTPVALAAEYAAADVLVFPTTAIEGFGMVRIEAMAAALPVITTEAGGGRELIRDGVDGYVVAYDAPDEIVERLRLLAQDPERRRSMGQSAMHRQRELFSEEAFAEALARSWRQALA